MNESTSFRLVTTTDTDQRLLPYRLTGITSGILSDMRGDSRARRRPKVTATLDPELLAAVDAHVAAHPDLARSAVIDQALRLWRARELESAMARQFAEPDEVRPAERAAWDAIRRAVTGRRLASEP